MAAIGSPALAGIDPWLATFSMALLRFPRTRGDRPFSAGRIGEMAAVPPHSRG